MLRYLARRVGQADGEGADPAARLGLITLVVGVVVLALHVFVRWWGAALWDDAFIFQRYAGNVLAGHGVAFNPGGEPTFGLTSLLYLAPVTLVRLGVEDPARAALITSVLCAGSALLLIARLGYRAAGGKTAGWLAAAAVGVVAAAPVSAEHVVSGMDTWFGVGYLAVLLWLLHGFAQRPATWLRVGVMAGVAFWVRPELVLFGGCVALSALVLPTGEATRRDALKLGITTAGTVLVLMATAWAYFDVPLPLPFFTKASGVYGPGFLRIYRGRSWSELGHFFAQVWPLLIPIGVEFGLSPRRWWRSAGAPERGIAVAAVLLLLFHALIALPIMGMHGRFYQPVLAALVYLMGRSLTRVRARADELSGRLWPAAVVGANVLLWTQLFPVAGDAVQAAGARARHDTSLSAIRLAKEPGPSHFWPGLNELSEMPAITIATTEVGFIGVMAPQQKIVDLAGLNTKAYAFGPFDVEHLVDDAAPDLIYMPHPDYKDMVARMKNDERFKAQYVLLSRHRVGGSHFGVAIRMDGPHAKEIRDMVGRVGRSTERHANAAPPRGK